MNFSGSITQSAVVSVDGSSFKGTTDLSAFADGEIIYSITPTDLVGNMGTISTGVIVKDFTPPLLTNLGSVENILDTTVSLTGVMVDEPYFSGALVRYGTGDLTGAVPLVGTKDALSATLVGLLPNSSYNYSVEAIDLALNTATGAVGTFLTAPSLPNVSSVSSYVNLSNSGSLGIVFSGSVTDSGIIAIIALSGASMNLESLYSGGIDTVVFDSGAMAEAFSGMTTGTGYVTVYFSGSASIGTSITLEIPVDFETPVSNIGTTLDLTDSNVSFTGIVVSDTYFSNATLYYGIDNFL